jgi:hypothetical protein
VLRIRVAAAVLSLAVLSLAVLSLAVLGGCGFIGAGSASHSKPDGFVLRGYVQVGSGVAGTGGACTVTGITATGITAGATVRVSDPAGKQLAEGQLGAGVLDSAGHCNFPFELRAVPGGPASYLVTVDGRPAQTFPAKDLREDKPAIITVP